MKVQVADVQRIRCMDEEDRTCVCGERVSLRLCENRSIVICVSCGRHYDASRPVDAFPAFASLPLYKRLK